MGEFLGRQAIGPYDLIDQIASGGMGVVFRARHRRLNRIVALKILFPQYSSDSEFVTRFSREAQALAKLEHPNIVRIYDAEVDAGLYYLAMELAERGTLQHELSRLRSAGQQMPVENVITAVQQVAAALDFAHDHGFVHRDVKPSNILIGKDGRCMLTDFGLVLDESGSKLTRTATTLGTPEYMSPEQARGEVADTRSDIYSLGIVAYEMLAGEPPFKGSSALSVLNKQITQAPPPLSTFRSQVPAEVAAAVGRAMEKDPRRRLERAGDMFGPLQTRHAGDEGSGNRAIGPSVRPARFSMTTAIIVLAAVVCVAGAVAAFAVMQNRTTDIQTVGQSMMTDGNEVVSTGTLVELTTVATFVQLAPTQTLENTPEPARTNTAEPTQTATPEMPIAKISTQAQKTTTVQATAAIRFCRTPRNDICRSNLSRFNQRADDLFGVWAVRDLAGASVIEMRWTVNGESRPAETCTISNGKCQERNVSPTRSSIRTDVSGEYRLDVLVEGKKLLTGTFSVK